MPEITIDQGELYVRMPSAIEPGLAEKVLKELPSISKERLDKLFALMKNLYPKEMEILVTAFNTIDEAVRLSKKR